MINFNQLKTLTLIATCHKGGRVLGQDIFGNFIFLYILGTLVRDQEGGGKTYRAGSGITPGMIFSGREAREFSFTVQKNKHCKEKHNLPSATSAF